MTIQTHHRKTVSYLQKGENPSVLLLSGMHGDEYPVISLVREYVESHEERLPNFLYIPEVSPSAVLKRKRTNVFGHDINRSFVLPAHDLEALQVMDILSDKRFIFSIDIHEDPTFTDQFYFYDTGEMHSNSLHAFLSTVESAGVHLYSGIDDPEDPSLGCMVRNGYVPKGHEVDSHNSGFLTKWMVNNLIVQRSFTFEIPGKADISTKQRLITTIFTFFLESSFMLQ